MLTPAGLQLRRRVLRAMTEPPAAIRRLPEEDQRALLRHPPARGRPIRRRWRLARGGAASLAPEVKHEEGHAHPRRRHRAGGRGRDAPDHRGGRREHRVGRSATPARASSSRASPPACRRTRIESIRKTRVVLKGPLEHAGRLRREERQRHAAQAVRDLRQHPPGARAARRRRRRTAAAASTSSSSARTSRTSTPASSTCRRPGVAQCLKLISRKGCEKIVRLAFEFARAEGRKTVACATKSNIMKMTEGHAQAHLRGGRARSTRTSRAGTSSSTTAAHQLVKKPEQFDVIVTTNMNGDIMSDLTSALDRRARLRAVGEPRQRTSRSSRPCTARRRSTPARTSSTRRPSSARAS